MLPFNSKQSDQKRKGKNENGTRFVISVFDLMLQLHFIKAAQMKLPFPLQDLIFSPGGRDYPAYLCEFHSSTGKASLH